MNKIKEFILSNDEDAMAVKAIGCLITGIFFFISSFIALITASWVFSFVVGLLGCGTFSLGVALCIKEGWIIP